MLTEILGVGMRFDSPQLLNNPCEMLCVVGKEEILPQLIVGYHNRGRIP
jgi:hypothetical protein